MACTVSLYGTLAMSSFSVFSHAANSRSFAPSPRHSLIYPGSALILSASSLTVETFKSAGTPSAMSVLVTRAMGTSSFGS